MTVIAMSQEMATLGKDVALGLCEALGLQQVRHEVGDVVAGRMHVKKSLIRRIREGKASRIEKWAADEKTISIFTAEEVFDLAVKDNVLIRGWGATLLLRAVPHIPCIRVCAPLEVRVKLCGPSMPRIIRSSCVRANSSMCRQPVGAALGHLRHGLPGMVGREDLLPQCRRLGLQTHDHASRAFARRLALTRWAFRGDGR